MAGDFFLVSEGPMDSTTIVIGDVVGHGVDAARRAAYVRAALATFAKFSSDPVRLLQFAHAALVERVGDSPQFVTAVCVNIAAPPVMRLSWACAGHEAPWYLDTAAPLEGGRASVPLGLATGVGGIEAGSSLLAPRFGSHRLHRWSYRRSHGPPSAVQAAGAVRRGSRPRDHSDPVGGATRTGHSSARRRSHRVRRWPAGRRFVHRRMPRGTSSSPSPGRGHRCSQAAGGASAFRQLGGSAVRGEVDGRIASLRQKLGGWSAIGTNLTLRPSTFSAALVPVASAPYLPDHP